METRFGHDFSRVKVHTDDKAAQSAKSVNALAYTVGNNLVFARGQYAPGSSAGRCLLAHELVHVGQQSLAGAAGPTLGIESSQSAEREADTVADRIVTGQTLRFRPVHAGTGLQRVPAAADNSIDSLPLEVAIERLPSIPPDQALRLLKRYQQFLIRSISAGEGRIQDLMALRAESFSNYLIGGAMEVFGGTSLPSDDWVEPWRHVNAAYNTLGKRQIKETLDHLTSAKHATIRKWQELNAYLEGSEKGAERSIASLEVIRDVSFVTVGAVGTVVTGGALGGAIIGTGITAAGQVAEQGTSVYIGIKKKIDWSGIAFDALFGFALSLLGGKIAQRLAGGTASAELVKAVSRNPTVIQFLKSIGGNLAQTTWKQLVQRALINVLYGRAQTIVQGTAKLLFDRCRGERASLTGEDFVMLLVEQLTSPRAYFMDILGGELGVLAHGYLQSAGTGARPSGAEGVPKAPKKTSGASEKIVTAQADQVPEVSAAKLPTALVKPETVPAKHVAPALPETSVAKLTEPAKVMPSSEIELTKPAKHVEPAVPESHVTKLTEPAKVMPSSEIELTKQAHVEPAVPETHVAAATEQSVMPTKTAHTKEQMPAGQKELVVSEVPISEPAESTVMPVVQEKTPETSSATVAKHELAVLKEAELAGTSEAVPTKLIAQESVMAATEVCGEGKVPLEKAQTLAPADVPTVVATSSKYSKLTIQQLRKLMKTDKEAVEALRLRYQNMTNRQLARLAKRGDRMAESVREQRIPTNKELQKILDSDYRPPHEAVAVNRDPQGNIIWSRKLKSGNMTPAEEALGYPQSALATHTEARAVTQAPLVKKGTLSISGQYDPCSSCQRVMTTAAKKSGATIIYWWPGGIEVFRP